MKLAYYIENESLKTDQGVKDMLSTLCGDGHSLVEVRSVEDLPKDGDALLSFGGDGTFLSAAHFAARKGIPVLGVNFGRLGFLSENSPESVISALRSGTYSLEDRSMLELTHPECDLLALNEVSVSRIGAAMLGVDISIDGQKIPTYWADGLLVATSSGSTAYALSVGGPVCTPDAKVLVIAPIAPHNLNVRPLVVPDNVEVGISLRSRDPEVRLTVDNRNLIIPSDSVVGIRSSERTLKRMVLGGNNFINALRSRLLWGQDVRNISEKE